MPPADLKRDTGVARLPAAPGWYTANLPDDWSFISPSGGVLMTVALRAMAQELGDEELRPRSANTLFCSPVPSGPLEIRVEVIRRGGAAAQVRAALSSTSVPGPGLEVSATFARERPGPEYQDVAPPEVTPIESAPPIPEDRHAFFRNIESRLAFGPRWWEGGWNAGPARYGRWARYKVPQRLPAGTIDPLSLPPIIDLMPAAVLAKVGPDHERFLAPSLDLTVHFLYRTASEWLLIAADAPSVSAGCGHANVQVFDPAGRLVAAATQMMMFRRWPTPEP
jgi:acyl-CoA thioesterase